MKIKSLKKTLSSNLSKNMLMKSPSDMMSKGKESLRKRIISKKFPLIVKKVFNIIFRQWKNRKNKLISESSHFKSKSTNLKIRTSKLKKIITNWPANCSCWKLKNNKPNSNINFKSKKSKTQIVILMKKESQISKKITNKKWLHFRKNWNKKIHKFHPKPYKSWNLMEKILKNLKQFKALKKRRSLTKDKSRNYMKKMKGSQSNQTNWILNLKQ